MALKISRSQLKIMVGFDNYLAGRAAWNERYGSYLVRERRWRWLALSSLGLAIIAVAGVVFIGSQNRLIPYIIEVDGKFNPLKAYPADQLKAPTTEMTKASLANWVIAWRTVTPDAELQRVAAEKVYAHISANTQAFNKLNAWYRTNNPFERAQTAVVHVEISNVLAASSTSWRLNWIERHQDQQATRPMQSLAFTALLTTEHGQINAERILLNPLALYISTIDWSQDAALLENGS